MIFIYTRPAACNGLELPWCIVVLMLLLSNFYEMHSTTADARVKMKPVKIHFLRRFPPKQFAP